MIIALSKFIELSKNCLKFSKTNAAIYIGVKNYSQSRQERSDISEAEQKSLHVAVIGVPNAGKSTFINNLINHRVCPTSSKVHTTRGSNKAICTTRNTQLVLHDTPGLVTQKDINKHNLEKSFKSAYRQAIQHADLIAVVHDVSNSWTRNELHATVIDTLKAYPAMPSILLLNKVDALKSKRILLAMIRTLTNDTLRASKRNQLRIVRNQDVDDQKQEINELSKREVSWSNFENVFMASSITGDGLNDVLNYLINMAKSRVWQYPSESFTDEKPENLIVASVRARLLDYLPQEIPYNLKCEMEFYSEEKNTLYASVLVTCPSARIERLICGESNGKLRQITDRVTSDLVETFGKPISLTICTTSKNDKGKKEATIAN